VPLSLIKQCNWYCPKGRDALWLGRSPVTVVLAESNGRLDIISHYQWRLYSGGGQGGPNETVPPPPRAPPPLKLTDV